MPLLATYGDGVTTRFPLPVHDQLATATVGGSAATLSSQDPFGVTFASAPALNAAVVISYNPQYQSGGSKHPIVLGQSAVQSSVTGTAAETVLASIVIPGGSMGPYGVVRVHSLWSVTNSANTKTLRVRFGGLTGAQYMAVALGAALTAQELTLIRNRGSQASQVGFANTPAASLGSSSTALVTSSVDTSADVQLVITGQLATTTESIVLESFSVELLKP
jgi:hypothetical protein